MPVIIDGVEVDLDAIPKCPHKAKRWTLVHNGTHYVACCGKCARRGEERTCWGCGADRFELRKRGGGQRLVSVDGKDLCDLCREERREEDAARELFYKPRGEF